MRFILAVIAVISTSVQGDSEFSPKTRLNELLKKTRQSRSEFERDSKQIDSLLQRVVGSPEKSSLVEVKSASQLGAEIRAFEQRKAALLQKDSQDVAAKQKEFNSAMAKLRQDTAALVRSKPASFLEMKSKYSDGNLDQFYIDSKAIVDEVRGLADSIRSKSEVIVDGVHKQLLEPHQH
jgi:hypothetical protein